jgi:acyl-CoA thioesterase
VVPPADVVVEVSELARGRRASQVRVHARVGNRSVFEAMGGTGERREGGSEATGVVRPDVPSPEECPPRPVVDRHRGRFMARSQARLARTGPSPDGRSAVWVRFPELEPGAATLAACGDYVPFGLRQVIGDGFATHSLDNTLRMRRAPGSGWVLADIVIEGVTGGFGHGSVRLWDESGELLATASQSFTCRPRPD